MSKSGTRIPSRSIEQTIEIDAPPETVWKALTDPKELTRWFPLEARVEPGVGGTIFYSWGERWKGSSRIEAWEPGKRLRMVGFPEAGQTTTSQGQSAEPGANGARLVVDFLLEGRDGKTILRLVHSGFGNGSEWDDEYHSVRRGWAFELRGLRHYLEKHRGRDRNVAWVRLPLGMTVDQAWGRLVEPGGLTKEGIRGDLREGGRYAVEMTSGESLAGVVEVWDPPFQFAGTVEGMGDAIMRLEIDRSAAPPEITLWLAAYDARAARVKAVEESWQAMVRRVLAGKE